jgi:DNA-binding transcriptional MerR regulator
VVQPRGDSRPSPVPSIKPVSSRLFSAFVLSNLRNLRNLWVMSRGRAARLIQVSPADVTIPDKLYFRIGEVSDLTRTKAFVLRYWETEFASLRPVKSKSGHRLYRRKDVELIFRIRQLLYEKGFTIEGARRHLASNGKTAGEQKHLFHTAPDMAELKAIRRELQTVLTMLSRKC